MLAGCQQSVFIISNREFRIERLNPKSKYVVYLSVLSQISNCQGLGRKNKHEISKTDRIPPEAWSGLLCEPNDQQIDRRMEEQKDTRKWTQESLPATRPAWDSNPRPPASESRSLAT